ncbi:MAG: hypothetical protein COA78_12075 [Blastopirellula sp.]|nr:MAG: hypothetical protein COA78_12075 [Blastopirellula sp.]
MERKSQAGNKLLHQAIELSLKELENLKFKLSETYNPTRIKIYTEEVAMQQKVVNDLLMIKEQRDITKKRERI